MAFKTTKGKQYHNWENNICSNCGLERSVSKQANLVRMGAYLWKYKIGQNWTRFINVPNCNKNEQKRN